MRFYARVWPQSGPERRRTLAPEFVQRSSVDDIDEEEAEACAEDYFRNHDGFEANWPLTFAIFDGFTGPEIGRWEVALEYEPTFTAAIAQQKGEA
ncbi:hypothetical protein ACOTDN_17935 [Achromobacter xylosoxidans]|uniref:Uncharacterized protein n=1 Tax=Achromobacter spanius TaxID=217203 RepID=A0AAW3I5W3_9BURK|nr:MULTISPECIES: hypothetical protein [Achromobacter]KNE28144.1 hypothetical protein AFM18_08200 [Achromobacter spanius]QYJ23392.1 hypothetical protein KYT87_09315 [Achromobacter sp. ES-001]